MTNPISPPIPDRPTRRRFLQAGAMAAATLVPGCAALDFGPSAGSGPGPGNAAMLLPLSGDAAALGRSLQSAIELGGGPGLGISVIDSGSTPDAAIAAARQALDQGANLIVGPVFSDQVEALRGVVPSDVPILTLSNNADLAGNGVFVFGVTPAQSVQAVFSLAAQRNMGRIAVVAPPGALGAQSIAAAQDASRKLGIRLDPPLVRESSAGLLDALSAGGGLPDAIYLPTADATLGPFAEALAGSGIQLMGSTQWAALDLGGIRALQGAWFAAPDPLRFAAFDQAFREATGETAGIIAGLAYDGAELLRTLARTGEQNRRGVTRKEGFSGVVGPYRFDPSGECQRGLSVLSIDGTRVNLIASSSV
jgi:branched-chain amino acid transport system substrate-binding protein